MYRIFSARVQALFVAWFAVGLFVFGQFMAKVGATPVSPGTWMIVGWMDNAGYLLAESISHKLKWTAVAPLVWLLLSIFFLNPIWRFIWKCVPKLNSFIFPDLNGEWDVELCSNWPRHLQVLEAAESPSVTFDIRKCDASDLAPLTPMVLRAKIYQTWWKIEMVLSNPAGNSPIERSDAINVEPFRHSGLLPGGISYFYKQKNQAGNLADDIEFYGAARVDYDADANCLEGLFWTARMWARAINTGGKIKFTRRP